MVPAGAEIICNVGNIAGEIARLIHHANEVLANDAIGGCCDVEIELISKMFGQGLRLGERGAEIILVTVE